ncbi:MAG: hypothetical protein M0Q49_05510 [Porticoccaceae bacterium]|nr:hypothetical protein [Porticoccaceae bacterium]
MMDWLRTVSWLLLTGGLSSPLRAIKEGVPYRVVKAGGRLIIEEIPTQYDVDAVRWFKSGDRVVVLPHAGFHRNACGSVSYHAPDGRVWVRRDGASSDVFFYPHELDWEQPQ